ncbi:protein aurora borealis [Nothobranchius furzeri]|uniref:Protein aurora borealis n=1 Tax=Nothobranchius furzeri TaxID=105023 RepID=A0A1A7ZTW1_NOTFU|nr:aurora kinase A activator [Nothobranchius furzeri]
MGDHIQLQITPETPGRSSIRNPFESPNDYHHLREPLVPSPSVFKSKTCKATPSKFNWSIDEMASLLPVHIDPEEIQRQSLYLSQTRIDSDIEEKCQSAIEQFFTKGAIVPSPWAAPETRRAPHLYNKSPGSATISEATKTVSVACQTALSLPLGFDLEKLLGEHYRYEEAGDAVQESLSSSSLRRKLFLDGHFSYSSSDGSNPPSPERAHAGPKKRSPHRERAVTRPECHDVFSSPLSCGVPAQTPSTGQFSSSPIQQGGFRDCSLGSISSPLFPDRSSPAGLTSPTVSPIFVHAARTPIGSGGQKQHSRLTPHRTSQEIDAAPCNESPYVEGCSPIRSFSPHQLHHQNEQQYTSKPRPRIRYWASPPLISQILNPKLQDNQEGDEHPPSTSSSSHPLIEIGPTLPPTLDTPPAATVGVDPMEAVEMEEVEEIKGDKSLAEEEEDGGPSEQLTSSRMGSVSAAESCQMFVSLLAEGSSIRCDSSIQVDSGYNTTSAGTASLNDGFSSDCQNKEPLGCNLVEESFPVLRHTKVKVFYPHH